MFYICWGTKIFRKKNGIAADFCPICRCPSSVDMEEIRSQPHIYHIGLGQGTVVGHACRCQSCKTEWGIQAGTIRGSVTPAMAPTLESLILQTFPRFDVVYGERLQQEAMLRRDPYALHPDLRMSLIAEPFFVLESELQAESRSTSWQSVVGALAGVAAFFFGIVGLISLTDNAPVMGVILLLATAGLIYFAYRMAQSGREKFMKQQIYPRLALCLSPLCPSEGELTQILRGVNTKCAKRTKLTDLLPLLNDGRAPVRVPQPAMADV